MRKKDGNRHGFPLSEVLSWAPLCIADIIRDYVFLGPGIHLYPQDYETRSAWDTEFYIVRHGEFRKYRGLHVVKYKAAKCDFPNGFHEEMRILRPVWVQGICAPEYPSIKISQAFHQAHHGVHPVIINANKKRKKRWPRKIAASDNGVCKS